MITWVGAIASAACGAGYTISSRGRFSGTSLLRTASDECDELVKPACFGVALMETKSSFYSHKRIGMGARKEAGRGAFGSCRLLVWIGAA